MHPVSISAEPVLHLFGMAIPNSLLTAWVTMAVLLIFAFAATWRVKLVPSGLQNLFETILEAALSGIEGMMGDSKEARRIFGLAVTIFFFVLFSNWMGLLPGVGSIGFQEQMENGEMGFVPLFRAASSDLSFTIALAILSVLYIQWAGIRTQKWHYLGKFFNFSSPMNFFVGLLELISEISKLLSFSFRLFGNVFAGEVLLVVVTFLMPYVVPVPFYGLELFVGFIQAIVFSILTVVFSKTAMASHH